MSCFSPTFPPTALLGALLLLAANAGGAQGLPNPGILDAETLEIPATRDALAGNARASMPSDQDITDKVDGELAAHASVPAHRIDVSTSDGIVTLSGSVGNLLARKLAARIAETVKGVRTVVNTIVVAPVERSDGDIESDIMTALVVDPAADSYEVTVNVVNGVATLGGSVGSWHEQQLAGNLAESIRGVRSVENRISIDYSVSRTDMDIRNDVQSRLRWDRFVDNGLIDVAVTNGNVKLSGTVGSAAEKSLARSDAWVIGVNTVDDSKLEVAHWARDDELRANKYAYKADEEILDAVRTALLLDPRVSSYNTDVSVRGGIVTLRGQVDSAGAQRAAAETARNTVGVVTVRNHTKVRPGKPVPDSTLVGQIAAALTRDAYVDRFQISPSVIDGVAYLSGTVGSYFEKAHAETVAAGVPGVAAVRNNLDVENQSSPLAYDPYVYGWYPGAFEWWSPDLDRSLAYMSDREIQRSIEEELWWSPFVDDKDVEVQVQSGVATLSGTVDSWQERTAAGENAREGGAARVVNLLAVSTDWRKSPRLSAPVE